MSDLTDKQRARIASDLQAALAVADGLASRTDEARTKLAGEIMRARAAGLTVPEVSTVLGWSQANTFRVCALAKKRATTKSK